MSFVELKKSIYIKKNGIRVETQLIEQKKKLNRDGGRKRILRPFYKYEGVYFFIGDDGEKYIASYESTNKDTITDEKILYYDPNSFKKHIWKDDSYIYVDYTWEDGNPFEWTHDGFLFLVEISFLIIFTIILKASD